MRTTFLLILLAIAPFGVRAQGIQFYQGDLAGLFAKAKAERKSVFVDVYTTWCGPCKLMSKTMFPDSVVGAFFNPRFISYKIDAEKGEGVGFAAQHKVAAYPTSLFFNPDGEMIYQHVGFEQDRTRFITVARTALDEIASPENLQVMRKRFAGGQVDSAFLFRYLDKLHAFEMTGFEARTVAIATYKRLSPASRRSPRVMLPLVLANSDGDADVYEASLATLNAILLRADTNQPLLEEVSDAMLAANEALLPAAALQGKKALETRLEERRRILLSVPRSDVVSIAEDEAMVRLRLAQNHKRYEALNPQVPAFVKQYWLSETDSSLKVKNQRMLQDERPMIEAQLAADASLTEEGRRERMAEIMSRNLALEELTIKFNNVAWAYYLMHRPTAEQAMAVTWIDYALKLRPDFANAWDTKAHLHEDLKQYAKAVDAEQKGLAAAQAAGDDTDDYERNLARFQKKLVEAKSAGAKPAAKRKPATGRKAS